MTFIYRLLSFIINLFSLFIAIMLLGLLPLSLSLPALWFPLFVLIAIVLYSWFSTRFRHQVLRRQQQVKRSLRDWIRVNGFVAMGFSILSIPSVINMLKNPAPVLTAYKEMMKQLGNKLPTQEITVASISSTGYMILGYFTALLIHVLWTFALLKKNEAFFEK